jgi:hypothetical protein
MPNKSKKKKSQRNRRQREVAEGLEAFEEQLNEGLGVNDFSERVRQQSERIAALEIENASLEIENASLDPDAAQPSSSPLSPALLLTSPPSPPTSSGLTSTGVWIFSLRFVFLSLEHAALSVLQPSIPTRPRVFHPRSTTVHLLCL